MKKSHLSHHINISQVIRVLLIVLFLGVGIGFVLSVQDKNIKRSYVALVTFPDIKRSISIDFVKRRLFTQLDRYVREMSYGRVGVAGRVSEKWYCMPYPSDHYKISSRNLAVDPERLKMLIYDVLDAIGSDVDLSGYSSLVIFLAASRDEYGMIGLSGYPGLPIWQIRDIWGQRLSKNRPIGDGIAIYTYQAHMGTIFHDWAHVIGGLRDGRRVIPCLYDHDLQDRPGPARQVFLEAMINMGFWDPMSCHYYKWRLPPPGVSSWTKLRFGWLDPSKVKIVKPGENTAVLLEPLERKNSKIYCIKIPISPTSYYLIENRQPIGFDRYLPASGVLIMIADDAVEECLLGKAPVRLINADPARLYLEGAAFDVGSKDVWEDREHNIRVCIKAKLNDSYLIEITPLL